MLQTKAKKFSIPNPQWQIGDLEAINLKEAKTVMYLPQMQIWRKTKNAESKASTLTEALFSNILTNEVSSQNTSGNLN